MFFNVKDSLNLDFELDPTDSLGLEEEFLRPPTIGQLCFSFQFL